MKPSAKAIALAKEALMALGKEELLFCHHQGVIARPDAYERLAEFFEKHSSINVDALDAGIVLGALKAFRRQLEPVGSIARREVDQDRIIRDLDEQLDDAHRRMTP